MKLAVARKMVKSRYPSVENSKNSGVCRSKGQYQKMIVIGKQRTTHLSSSAYGAINGPATVPLMPIKKHIPTGTSVPSRPGGHVSKELRRKQGQQVFWSEWKPSRANS